MTPPTDTAARFAKLFDGRTDAYGLGRGESVRKPVTLDLYQDHLNGRGSGLGIYPLRDDGTIMFAAIDLDEADFDAAREMQEYIPGTSWLERSRSGNAHVWVFFSEPIEAWLPRGVLQQATLAAGKRHVEVFPKQDSLREGSIGNYINLPFHGDARPIIHQAHGPSGWDPSVPWNAETFAHDALDARNAPDSWRRRAAWYQIAPPEQRERSASFGASPTLHICAEHIIANRDEKPVTEGHRAVVYFCLAKQLTNYEGIDHDEALDMMRMVNDASPDRVRDSELRRILHNAESGAWTSTGCDDPLFEPYAHPDCPIAHQKGTP